MTKPFAPALLLLALLAACGDAEAPESSAPRGVDVIVPGAPATSSPEASAAGAAPAPTPAASCDANQTSALQAALDASHPAHTDAVLAIDDPACGVRFFSSGPSKLTPGALHRIASVSKTHTASVILSLVDDGKISLDDPASRWLSGVPGNDSVHVRHLLQHTSGIGRFEDTLSFRAALVTKRTYTPDELLALAFSHGLKTEPGKTFAYSNANYIALGVIAEKVTGQTLAKLIRERELESLPATETFFAGVEPIEGTMAVGKNSRGADVTNLLPPSWYWAAGMMVASPIDTLFWIQAFAKGTRHKPATVAEMHQTVPFEGAKGWSYGLGVMVMDASLTRGGGLARGHAGDLDGYHTAAFHFPDKDTTVVSVIDHDPPDLTTVRDSFFAALSTLFAPKK